MKRRSLSILVVLAFFVLTLLADKVAMAEKVIQFSGYTWEVKSGYHAPGKNQWSDRNVWVDEAGRLHLKISREGGIWYCAELFTLQSFRPGRFEFQIEGPVGQFDPFVVLGLFLYPDPKKGPAEENEVDIEFARWGKAENPAGSYTVMGNTHPYPFSLADRLSTHVLTWGRADVGFQSYSGQGSSEPEQQYHDWIFHPAEFHGSFPAAPLRIHLNLWLFRGHSPVNGEGQEIIIHRVTYVPL
ncbi:MAG: glycoside hydrolase family 16 protein [Negativicutes bacterium]|nr:glycoside hydrolase family 16 protein [Negativicutes bacterium]